MAAAEYALHMDINRQTGKQTKQQSRQTAMNNEKPTKRKEDSLARARQTGIYGVCIYVSPLSHFFSSKIRSVRICVIYDTIVASHAGPMWLLPLLNEAGCVWVVAHHNGSMLCLSFVCIAVFLLHKFSHIRENWSEGRCSCTFYLRAYTEIHLTCTVDVCLGGISPVSPFHSSLCHSLHVIQPFLWQSLFSPFPVIRNQMWSCHVLAVQVCVGGKMRLLPHYPLFYPFASALKHPPLFLSSILFLSHRWNLLHPPLLCLSSITLTLLLTLPAAFPEKSTCYQQGLWIA